VVVGERRGFLKTLATAVVTAVVGKLTEQLWTPRPAPQFPSVSITPAPATATAGAALQAKVFLTLSMTGTLTDS
jgi:hypothetical protein